MSGLALLMIAIGLFIVVIAFKGKQDNLIAAATGKAYKGSTLT